MSLTRYTGGREFDTLRREMDRLFDSFLPQRSGDETASAVWAPRADLMETDDAYIVAVDVPGIEPEKIDVTFEDGTLKISGEREASRREDSGQFHRIERSYGRFFRSFRFGNVADSEQIDASFNDGVLTIKLGKREASKPRKIEIGRSGSGDGSNVDLN
jgi:HSP20 family protein